MKSFLFGSAGTTLIMCILAIIDIIPPITAVGSATVTSIIAIYEVVKNED